MKKRVLSVFLAAAMAASVAGGCGTAPAVSSGKAAPASATVSQSGGGNAPTIKILNSKSSGDFKVWPTKFVQQMDKDLGVNVEFVAVTDDQFDLSLASGTAPYDIADCSKYREKQVLDSKMAVCLDDYLGTYAKNIAKYKDANNLTREFLSNGTGKLYFTRCQMGPEPAGTEVWDGYVVRWDWYKELGYPAINSDADYFKVLQEMLKKHPTNDAGGKTYGIGQYVGTGLWSWTIFKQAQLGYASVVKGLELDLHNGNIFNMFTDDRASYWKAMEYFNTAYNLGLMDPDDFTMKQDDLTQKVDQGTYAGALRTWDVGDYGTQEVQKDANTLKGYESVFPEKGGVAGYYGCDAVAGWENNSMFVCSKCKNIEKAVSVLDYLYDDDHMRNFYSGFKGEEWDAGSDGTPAMTEAGIKALADPTAMDKLGIYNASTCGSFGYYCGKSPISKHPDGGFYSLAYAPDALAKSLNAMQKDYSDHYNVDYPAQLHEKQVAAGIAINRKDEPKDLYMVLGDAPADYAKMYTQVASIAERSIPDLVMAKTPEEYNSIKERVISEFKAAGSDKLYQWASTSYTAAKAKLDAAEKKYGIKHG